MLTYSKIINDEHSYVSLIATLPDYREHTLDESVVAGARVSYRGSGSKGTEKDRSLIQYLMSNEHMSPFEQPQLQFEFRMPLATAVHVLRHRSFHINGESSRYKELKDEYYIPQFRLQDDKNKQASYTLASDEDQSYWGYEALKLYNQAYTLYQDMLSADIAREQARYVLPVGGMYVSYVFTSDLRNLLHFVSLRSDSHAQWETQQLSHAIYWLIAPYIPLTSEAWNDTIPVETVNNLLEFKQKHGEPVSE